MLLMFPMNYYNENDPKAAQWLRQLIAANLISPGEVDTRSIVDVEPADLTGFNQCHFFAGIGGWSYALRLAGVKDQEKVWTGSCPCQPFSQAGSRLGTTDPRHLWPFFRNLIGECRPPAVFGEQVASPAGRQWFAGVSADLEALAYPSACADLCAAGVGSPHIRQRLYWVAHDSRQRRNGWSALQGTNGRTIAEASGGMVQPNGSRWDEREFATTPTRHWDSFESASSWRDFDVILCRDGKSRRVKSSLQCVAHGVPGRMVKLRGFGNAIVPELAAQFVNACLKTQNA